MSQKDPENNTFCGTYFQSRLGGKLFEKNEKSMSPKSEKVSLPLRQASRPPEDLRVMGVVVKPPHGSASAGTAGHHRASSFIHGFRPGNAPRNDPLSGLSSLSFTCDS